MLTLILITSTVGLAVGISTMVYIVVVTRRKTEPIPDHPDYDLCPDCCRHTLVDGPRGGLSQNVYCTAEDCGSEFNDMGPFGVQRISPPQPNKRRPS